MSQALIQVRGLVKAFDVFVVIRKLDLDIQRGEFVALLGPNGSGKSTLLRMLCGLSGFNGGSIHIGGWQLPQEMNAIRAQIGFVSHKTLLYDNLTARENLAFFARLYQLPDAEARVKSILHQVGLTKRSESVVRTFSRGMQQRLSIARALLHDPDILILDEPYTGLDQDAAVILDELLLQSHAEGRTILMTTHQLDRVNQLAQRVLILNRGVISYDAPSNALDSLALISEYTQLTGTANRT